MPLHNDHKLPGYPNTGIILLTESLKETSG